MSTFNQVENPQKAVSSEEAVVNDFERRIPYWSYRPTNYKVFEPFMEYKSEIDGYLEKLFNGEIDDGNGDVLDNMIMDMARQAEKSLAKQHTEHGDIIKSFDIRAKSDRIAFEDELKLLRDRLDICMKKQAKYKELLEEDEFIIRRK